MLTQYRKDQAIKLSRRQFITLTAGSVLLPSTAFAGSNDLQKQLNWLIKRQRREGRISSIERTAWSVYDFRTQTKLVAINEDRAMQAASMIKLFVALAYFYLNQQAPQKYPYGTRQRTMMEKMLVKSNNNATNAIMRWCRGPANVMRLCQKATGSRFKQLRIVEYIPQGGKTYRNKASAHDYSRFYYDLWHERLPHSYELKRILSIENHDRITSEQMPYYSTVYDKTGSTGMLCGDAGIIQLENWDNAYTVIGIIERRRKTKQYGRWITVRSDAMREVSSLIYRFMASRYQLLDSLA